MNRRLPGMLIVFAMLVAGGRSQPLFGAAEPSSAAQQLEILQQGDAGQRERAVRLLGVRPGDVAVTAPALLNAMRRERDNQVVVSIRSALIAIGKPAVPHIAAVMADWPADRIRELVVVLAVIGPDAAAAIPDLRELQQSPDPRLRRSVQFALNSIQPGQTASGSGGESTAAVTSDEIPSSFADSSSEKQARFTIAGKVESPVVESEAAPQIRQVAATIDQVEADQQPASRAPAFPADDESQSVLTSTPAQSSKPTVKEAAVPAIRPPAVPSTRVETSGEEADWWQNVETRAAAIQTQVAGLVAAYPIDWMQILQWIGMSYAAWVLIFFIVPTLFLEADLWLQRTRRGFVMRALFVGFPVIRLLLLLPWLCRSRYATSAWIDARSDGMVNRFWAQKSVSRHAGYVATPVRFSGVERSHLSPRDLKWVKQRQGAVVLIAGASGSGKHALAVEIAGRAAAGAISAHRSLPVFLQPGMEAGVAIDEQVQHLLGLSDDEAVRYESLLQRIRADFVLPIIEAGNESSAVIELLGEVRAVVGGCPVVVVAADEPLNSPSIDLRLEPVTPRGDRLREFVSEYLEKRGVQAESLDNELGTLCDGIDNLRIAGPLPIVLLTMFLDDYVRSRSGGSGWSPAESVVALVERHVYRQLSRAQGFGFDVDELRRDITELAKMSIAKTFQPQPVRRDAVLKRLEGWNAARRLEFLASELQLIEVDRGEAGTVTFRDRHVAVRLAAAARCESLDRSETRWKSALQQLRVSAQGSNVKPFTLALYDCCVASSTIRPDFVLIELGHLAGLDAERVQQDLLEQQTAAAAARLQSGDQSMRLDALKSLHRLAERSESAVSILIDAFDDADRVIAETTGDLLVDLGVPAARPLCERLQHVELEKRAPLVELLGRFGPSAYSAVPALLDLLADTNDIVRASAISAIAAIAPDALPPLAGLLHSDASTIVRAACIQAAGACGDATDEVVDSITAFLEDPSAEIRLAAVTALGGIGLASVGVVAGLLKALVAEEEAVRVAAELSLSKLRGLPDASVTRQTRQDVHNPMNVDSELQAAAA